MSEKIAIIFICEFGILEKLTVLLVKSLVKYGKPTPEMTLHCFTPRKQFRPAKKTLAILESHGVQIIDIDLNKKFSYYPLFNKPAVSKFAEFTLDADLILFLDSDTFILNDLLTDRNVLNSDISIQSEFSWHVAALNDQDSKYQYWNHLFHLLNIQVSRYTNSLFENRRMIGYWNSGVFFSRKSTGLLAKWHDNLETLMTKYRWRGLEYWFLEQASLACTVHQLQPSLYEFSSGYNYPISKHSRIVNQNQIHSVDELIIGHHLKEYNWMFDNLNLLENDFERTNWLISQFAQLQIFPVKKNTAIKDFIADQRNSNLQKLIYFTHRLKN